MTSAWKPLMLDVHTSHCCIRHGCKYADEECTVVSERAPQEYPCEQCTYMLEEDPNSLKDIIENLQFLARHPGWYYSDKAQAALTAVGLTW